MREILFRLAAFVAALLIAADLGLPARDDALVVDGHVRQETAPWRKTEPPSVTYTLWFAGDRPGSCEVGYTGYGALRDGDAVVVTSSRVFRSCERITRDGDVVYRGAPRWMLAVVAVALLAGSLGLFRLGGTADEDGVEHGAWR